MSCFEIRSYKLRSRSNNSIVRKYHFLYIRRMKAIVVTPKSDTEFKFVTDLLKKLGIGNSALTTEDIEDIGMLKLLNNVDKSKKVSRSSIMKKLSA